MITTYFKSTNAQSLASLRSFLVNVMPDPKPNVGAYTDDDGVYHEAVGEPGYWYIGVLAPVAIPPFNGVEACDEVTGALVCGIWA